MYSCGLKSSRFVFYCVNHYSLTPSSLKSCMKQIWKEKKIRWISVMVRWVKTSMFKLYFQLVKVRSPITFVFHKRNWGPPLPPPPTCTVVNEQNIQLGGWAFIMVILSSCFSNAFVCSSLLVWSCLLCACVSVCACTCVCVCVCKCMRTHVNHFMSYH